MPEEVSSSATEAVTKTSDGFVRISIEKYEELLEKVADQKSTMDTLKERLYEARTKPPVINRTVVEKTAEMAAQDNRIWGGTLMGLGASLFVVGALRYKAGKS